MPTILTPATGDHLSVILNVVAGLYTMALNFLFLGIAGIVARRWFARQGPEITIPVIGGIATGGYLLGWAVYSHLPSMSEWASVFAGSFLAVVGVLLIFTPMMMLWRNERATKSVVATGGTSDVRFVVSVKSARSAYDSNLIDVALTVIPLKKQTTVLIAPVMQFQEWMVAVWTREQAAVCIRRTSLIQSDKESTTHYVFVVGAATKRQGKLTFYLNHVEHATGWFPLPAA